MEIVDNATPNIGDFVTFTIEVTNNGPSDATNIMVDDVLPNGFGAVQNISNGGAISAAGVSWSGLSITNGQTLSLTH